MSDPLVSIVVPCYNAAPWLEAAIQSARAQTWRRLEIVLVDDGSTDGSSALADKLAAVDLRVIHQENRGQCAALNRGLSVAQGDFINYLDADDLMAPGKIAAQLRRLAETGPDTVASCAWGRFARDPGTATFIPEPVWKDLAPVDWIVTSWNGGGMMHGAAWLIPRPLVDRAGPWNEALSLINDLDYFPRVLLAGRGVAFCAETRTYYRTGQTGALSGLNNSRGWISAFQATALAQGALLRAENSPRTRRACADNLQRLIHAAYPHVPTLVRNAEAEVARLGGSPVRAEGGKAFLILARLFGWKTGRRIQIAARRLRAGRQPTTPGHA